MKDQIILVTGVSRGLGLVIARTLLERGCIVYGVSRQESPTLVSLKSEYAERLHLRQTDLAEVNAIHDSVFSEGFLSLQTPLHGVVNNAAIAYDDIITNFQVEPLEAMFRVNVTAPCLIAREAIRNMLLHHRRGAFVHLSSISAHTGYKGLSAYAATKGALEAFSKSLAREWGERGIRSNCIAAGFMETDMTAVLDETQRASIFKRAALKQPTDPASVAATVAFLLSEEAASITGETIAVDSGSI